MSVGPRGPAAGPDMAGPPAPDPRERIAELRRYVGMYVEPRVAETIDNHLTRLDREWVPAPSAGLTIATVLAHASDCPRNAPHEGACSCWPERDRVLAAYFQRVSPGAAARIAPTDAIESLASWVEEELVEGSDEREGATAVFWYCAYCDGPNGATRETLGHVASCPVGAAVTVLGALRAALAAQEGP